jgi:hypothetical protein
MENKMATPLGSSSSTNEKEVSQCDDKALGSFVELLVIEFDQEKFEELLSQSKHSLTTMSKHIRAYVAKTAIIGDPAPYEARQPTTAFNKPTLASFETITAPSQAKIASSKTTASASGKATARAFGEATASASGEATVRASGKAMLYCDKSPRTLK